MSNSFGASGLTAARVWAAESGVGVLQLDDLERLAVALGVKVVELFKPVGRTAEERLILALLEEDGEYGVVESAAAADE